MLHQALKSGSDDDRFELCLMLVTTLRNVERMSDDVHLLVSAMIKGGMLVPAR